MKIGCVFVFIQNIYFRKFCSFASEILRFYEKYIIRIKAACF